MKHVLKPIARHCFWITRNFSETKTFIWMKLEKNKVPTHSFHTHNPNFHFFCPTRIPLFQQQETKCRHSQSMAVHQQGEKKRLFFEKQLLFIHRNLKCPLAMITIMFDVALHIVCTSLCLPKEWGRLNESNMVSLERNA